MSDDYEDMDAVTLYDHGGGKVQVCDPNGFPVAVCSVAPELDMSRRELRKFKRAALQAKQVAHLLRRLSEAV